MKRFLHSSLSLFLLALATLFPPISFAAPPIDSSLAPMLQKVLPAIVNIRAQIKVADFNTLRELQRQRGMKQNNGDGDGNGNGNGNGNGSSNGNGGGNPLPSTFVSVGSGVIIDANNGFVVTNAHVINDAQTVTVTLSDGRHFTARIVGADRPSDVALLQIKGKNLVAVPMGDSNKLKVGDFVAAIGNPFGLGQTVTSGIISALGRSTLGIENYENFIQTDAPINPGNSGGALMNMQGELVGINTAILAPDRGSIGIGFAIPANMAKSVIQQLIEYGDVKRGLLGIGAQDLTPELAAAFNAGSTQGAAVAYILPNSPASQAGLQVGDIITSVNNTSIKNASEVLNTIGFLRVDTRTNISVLRDNKPLTVTVTLLDPKKRKQSIEQMDPFLYGTGLKSFTVLSPIHGNVQGVLVVGVEEDSNSWRADLRPGDVITSANQQKVHNIDELRAVSAKADKTLLLNVIRGPGAIFLVINKEP